MDELVKVVSEQTGLPKAQAEKAAKAVLDFLKDKLPAPIASQVDAAVSSSGTISAAEDLLKKGKGLFGKG